MGVDIGNVTIVIVWVPCDTLSFEGLDQINTWK